MGGLELSLLTDYLLSTRHGRAILVRGGLAWLLGFWSARPLAWVLLDRIGYALAGTGLLVTLSWVSHSGTMGTLPLIGDVIHLIGATLWAGGLLYLAWSPHWNSPQGELWQAVTRVSRLGLISVIVLFATGIYMAQLHMYGVEAMRETEYGRSLGVKLGLIAVILMIAAANRWLLMPRLQRSGVSRPLRLAVRAESLLLVAVLAATGVLATREPAHDHAGHAGHTHHHHDLSEPDAHAREAVHALELPSGTLILEPTVEGDLLFTLEGTDETQLSLEAISPSGAFYPLDATLASGETAAIEGLRLSQHEEILSALPEEAAGVWQLLGELGEEAFTFSFTRSLIDTPSGYRATLTFVPTPSLATQGLTELFAVVSENGTPVEVPVEVQYRMPGMQHASDDDMFELTGGRTHQSRFLKQATLAFPMAGAWEVTLNIDDDSVELTTEVLED